MKTIELSSNRVGGSDGGDWETSSEDEVGNAVENAHGLDNPLSPANMQFTLKTGATGSLKHFKVQQLEPRLMRWIMDLMTRNMKKMYKRSFDGWKLKKKQKEMTGKASRYLVGFNDKNKPVAFSHFQFDMDYGREVLYCYEIQIEQEMRCYGLGKWIMKCLEDIAKQARLPLVVLTVFKFNLPSLAFFKAVGYSIDETCPDEEEHKDYLIMSKKVC